MRGEGNPELGLSESRPFLISIPVSLSEEYTDNAMRVWQQFIRFLLNYTLLKTNLRNLIQIIILSTASKSLIMKLKELTIVLVITGEGVSDSLYTANLL